jgi:hypothetical protein
MEGIKFRGRAERCLSWLTSRLLGKALLNVCCHKQRTRRNFPSFLLARHPKASIPRSIVECHLLSFAPKRNHCSANCFLASASSRLHDSIKAMGVRALREGSRAQTRAEFPHLVK